MSLIYAIVMIVSGCLMVFGVSAMVISWASSLKVDWFITLDGKRVYKTLSTVELKEGYDLPTAPDPKRQECKIPSCKKRHYARGWCSTHYSRWRRHGSPLCQE